MSLIFSRKSPFLTLTGTLSALLVSSYAQAQTLHIVRPVSNAIVRETVPIKIAPGDLPSDGYVGITIDGKFRTARVLPENKNVPIYDWDTKAAYSTPDAPNTQLYVADGPHTLTIKLYNASGKSLGEQSIPLRVANKISTPAQAIKLTYHWKPDFQQRFLRQTELDIVGDDSSQPVQTLQTSSENFTRTVEDITDGLYLIRDRVLSGGSLVKGGQRQSLDSLYTLKSEYRTVSTQGEVVNIMAPLSAGDHIGFSIPILSSRRVAVGDTWQSPVKVALEWASLNPTLIQAESRLEGFEWQDGYPTAKIRETYTGPITFNLNTPSAGGASTMGGSGASPGIPNVNPGPNMGMNPSGTSTLSVDNGSTITAQTVNYQRVIYFAYNSGRLVRTETTLTLTTNLSQTQTASLGASSGNSAMGLNPMANGLMPPDSPGVMMPPTPVPMLPTPSPYPMMPGPGGMLIPPTSGMQVPGGYPGQNPQYPGSPAGGYGGGQSSGPVSTNLKMTDTISLG